MPKITPFDDGYYIDPTTDDEPRNSDFGGDKYILEYTQAVISLEDETAPQDEKDAAVKQLQWLAKLDDGCFAELAQEFLDGMGIPGT